MIVPAKIPICNHIKTDGVRCGSPALKGKRSCYYHYARPRVQYRQPELKMDDPRALQSAVGVVLEGLRTNTLDSERAQIGRASCRERV